MNRIKHTIAGAAFLISGTLGIALREIRELLELNVDISGGTGYSIIMYIIFLLVGIGMIIYSLGKNETIDE